jgi:hypothetical protein
VPRVRSCSSSPTALRDNLDVRGVLQRLKAALLAEIGSVLREGKVSPERRTSLPFSPPPLLNLPSPRPHLPPPQLAGPASAALANDPDSILSRSAIADYLASTGLHATLAVFRAETGADAGAGAGEDVEEESQGGSPLTREQQQLNRIGAVVAESLARGMLETAAGEAAAALVGGEGGGGEHTGSAFLPSAAAASQSQSPSSGSRRRFGGFLDAEVMALELGLPAPDHVNHHRRRGGGAEDETGAVGATTAGVSPDGGEASATAHAKSARLPSSGGAGAASHGGGESVGGSGAGEDGDGAPLAPQPPLLHQLVALARVRRAAEDAAGQSWMRDLYPARGERRERPEDLPGRTTASMRGVGAGSGAGAAVGRPFDLYSQAPSLVHGRPVPQDETSAAGGSAEGAVEIRGRGRGDRVGGGESRYRIPSSSFRSGPLEGGEAEGAMGMPPITIVNL